MSAYVLGSGLANYIDAFNADFGDPTDITRAQIKDLFVKSIRRVNWRIGTSFSYYTTGSGISPTPTEQQGDIILLQAECLFAKRRFATAVSKGISIKDGDTAIDTTSAFGGYKDIQDNICGDLDDSIKNYNLATNGAEINGYVVWYGNSNIISDHDHNGDADHSGVDYTSPCDDQ